MNKKIVSYVFLICAFISLSIVLVLVLYRNDDDLNKFFDSLGEDEFGRKKAPPEERPVTQWDSPLPEWIPKEIKHECPICGECIHNLNGKANLYITLFDKDKFIWDEIDPDDSGYILSDDKLIKAMKHSSWRDARTVQGFWEVRGDYHRHSISQPLKLHKCDYLSHGFYVKFILRLRILDSNQISDLEDKIKRSGRKYVSVDAYDNVRSSEKVETTRGGSSAQGSGTAGGGSGSENDTDWIGTYRRPANEETVIEWSPGTVNVSPSIVCECGE